MHVLPCPSDQPALGAALQGAFAQPVEQRLPVEFLALLIELDRVKRASTAHAHHGA